MLSTKLKDTNRLKLKGRKKIFKAHGNQKRCYITNCHRRHARDIEGHFILIKGSIHQEHIKIINIYALNTQNI